MRVAKKEKGKQMYSKENQISKHKPEKEKGKRYKKCRYCGEPKVPYGSLQPFCFSNECIREHNEATIQKKKRKEKKLLLNGDRTHWIKLADKAFNAFIRERDKGLPCISCGYIFKDGGRQAHAGHLKPKGVNSILRYNEDNVHVQCSICNNFKSGEVGEYERNLRERIGDDRVDYILAISKQVYSHTLDELKNIVTTYTKKKKELLR